MESKPLYITDAQMLKLCDILIALGRVKNEADFALRLGMYQMAITSIKNGTQSFTVRQIEIACETFNVDYNFIFGQTSIAFMSSRKERRKITVVSKIVTKTKKQTEVPKQTKK